MTYVSVPKEDHDHDERDHASLSLALPPPNNIPPSASSKRHRPIVIGALLAITVCLGMAIVILHDIPSVPKGSPPQMHFSCGSTAVEARTAGCQFDLTTFTWVPPACFDEPLMEDFLASRNWTWSLDRAGQFLVNETFARTGDFDQLYTTMRYHVVHCAYAWRKLHRSLFGGDLSGIDGYIASIHHTEHCLEMMLKHGDLDRLPGVGVTKFASCGQGALKEKSQHGWFRMMDGEKVYTLPTHV
ncbi:hypothetical protein P875_00138325 [Aspergillus parasiticus SU-1]|uniref:Uncharacterized protein n=1 Tax=Aspergillus parasiticus (strain ATCC 56775 / NRRL 5862 / SRRC 143 / SU-1) TaxID=1403190 RepID=A0A0F0IAV1_ASPPU|nr:hypothetical protein P875_00138325 [Aspergillus parasiticus SU-1]